MAPRQDSFAQHFSEVAVMVPWWAGVVLAGAAWHVCHSLALGDITAAAKPGQTAQGLERTLWVMLASFGEYVLPVVFLAAAVALVVAGIRGRTRFRG